MKTNTQWSTKMKREQIKELTFEKQTKISGWVETFRDTRYMIFIVLKDASGKVQVSVDKGEQPKIVKALKGVIDKSVLSFEGHLSKNDHVKMGGMEFLPSSVEVLSLASALPIEPNASIDQRLNYRWIDLREDKKQEIFKIQTTFTNSVREFLLARGFVELHSPKLIGTASESGSDVFEVKYFDGKAYLAQSPQFYKQMAMASGFERIFEVGPVFRAEQSHTARHSTEFTGLDLEFAFIDSYEDVMKLQEEMIHYALNNVNNQHSDVLKNIFEKELVVPTLPFPRMKLADLYAELEERYGYKVEETEKNDLTTEAERLACELSKEKFGHEFLFVTDYPTEKRAFYHMEKNGFAQGYDLLWRGVEITTGAQREHRYEILKQKAKQKGLEKDVEFYLEFFKYGCPPHGGFGLGVDRFTALLLGLPKLKEAEYIFRGPNRLTP